MKNEETIEHDGQVVAIIARKDMDIEGVKFLSPESYPFQFGVMVHKSGGALKPHIHKKEKRVITETQEMIHVDYGKVAVDLYDEKGNKFDTFELEGGDTVLLVGGGHGFRFLEDTKMTEVKQGLIYSDVITMQAKIQSMAKEEMTRTQRDYFLREQLKAIRQELGETDDLTAEVEEMKDKVEEVEMPDKLCHLTHAPWC